MKLDAKYFGFIVAAVAVGSVVAFVISMKYEQMQAAKTVV